MRMTVSRRVMAVRRGTSALIVLAVVLAGCAQIRLIGPYDEQIDRAATELQKRMDRFLVQIAADPTAPEARYESNKAFYIDYEVDLQSVLVRAQAQPKYPIVQQQFTLMLDSLQQLRTAHQSGPLSAEVVTALRVDFNQAWGAIIKLQMELKRGA